MGKGLNTKAVAVVLLTGTIGVAAMAYYVKTTPQAQHLPTVDRQEELIRPEPTHSVHKPVAPTKKPESAARDHVFLPVFEGEKVVLAKSATAVPEDADPRAFLTDQIAKAMKLDGVKTIGVDVRRGTAVVTFNDAIDSGMGSMQEGQFLQALQIGFGQFPEVERLVFNKNGEQMKSLGEHIDLTDPVPVIRPGQKSAATKTIEP